MMNHIVGKETQEDILQNFNLVNWPKILQSMDPTDQQTKITHNILGKINYQLDTILLSLEPKDQIKVQKTQIGMLRKATTKKI